MGKLLKSKTFGPQECAPRIGLTSALRCRWKTGAGVKRVARKAARATGLA